MYQNTPCNTFFIKWFSSSTIFVVYNDVYFTCKNGFIKEELDLIGRPPHWLPCICVSEILQWECAKPHTGWMLHTLYERHMTQILLCKHGKPYTVVHRIRILILYIRLWKSEAGIAKNMISNGDSRLRRRERDRAWREMDTLKEREARFILNRVLNAPSIKCILYLFTRGFSHYHFSQ